MTVPEAPLEDDGHGAAAAGPGWFVLNLAEARALRNPRTGVFTAFEPPERFPDYGIGVHVIAPGQANALYHEESNQEDFLVLSGECIVVIEEQERRLRPWDFVHCPAGTRHVFVGAGDGPCAILMVGTRRRPTEILYPASEVAARHGAAAREPTTSAREAYADFPGFTAERFRWPPR
jgi:uncharacterized cupin superfamily protein